MILGEEMSEIN